ncbi:MAG: glycosyltransferase family 39 protein, partial [Pseudomonadota bacterium]|nr:glycosyltransferase family 39 protein [Pseudomonadota bacterium]
MTRNINTLLWLVFGVLAFRLGLTAILPFADTTEPRYAEIARIMAETGDWITPWFDYNVPFWGKPPLSFWTQALAFKLLGVSEFAGRLPSWLANLAIVYLVFTARRYLHPERNSEAAIAAGLWAALIYATTALGFLTAGTVMTDSFLALGSTLTLVGLIVRLQGGPERWGWLFFAGLAIGLLAKGPLVLVLTGLPVLLWVAVTRNWLTLWRALPWIRGTLLMLALAVPWYVLAELKTPGFLDYFLVGEHFKRFVVSSWQGDLYGNAHEFPRGTIWLYLVAASFPWGLIALVLLARRLWLGQSPRQEWQNNNAGIDGLVLAAMLSPALFFTLAGNILWTYVLPGLPFLAVLASGLWPAPLTRMAHVGARLAVLLVPALGTAAGGWFALHPGQLKTERELVARVNQIPAMDASDLFYLDQPPFSARFYSHGEARGIDDESVVRLLDTGTLPQPMALAVEKGNAAMLDRLGDIARPVAENRRYRLFLLTPTSASTAVVPDESRKAGGIDYNSQTHGPLG